VPLTVVTVAPLRSSFACLLVGCFMTDSVGLMGFPSTLQAREDYILAEVRAGRYEATLAPLYVQDKDTGTELTVWVYADALKVNGVRVNASASLQQRIADALECSLLTAKLADLIWLNRGYTLPPRNRAITSSTEAMIEHSRKIDALLPADLPLGTIVSTVGKHWLIDNELKVGSAEDAVNYGWHFEGLSYLGMKGEAIASLVKDPKTKQYLRLIQGRGFRHGRKHTDYSQTVILVSLWCEVNGVATHLHDVLRDPKLAKLISHQGVLRVLRQPVLVRQKPARAMTFSYSAGSETLTHTVPSAVQVNVKEPPEA